MKEQMKKIALLSLSLILTSAYSVSIVLPSLLQHFSEYTTAQVEILISAPSFAITVMIVLNAWLSRYMKDRPMIVGGLLLLSVSGMVPVFVQEYPVVLASRIFLGIGIGLINAKAISIFSEYYEGREKAALLGYRGSAEVLGSAVMTLVAGKLVLIRWNLAFWVYALGFVIVLLYLVWVPGSMETGQSAGSQSAGAEKESLEAEADEKRECWKKEVLTIAYALFAGFVICIYCSNSLRVPMLILEKKLGTESEASIILTLMMLMFSFSSWELTSAACLSILYQINHQHRILGASCLRVTYFNLPLLPCCGEPRCRGIHSLSGTPRLPHSHPGFHPQYASLHCGSSDQTAVPPPRWALRPAPPASLKAAGKSYSCPQRKHRRLRAWHLSLSQNCQ